MSRSASRLETCWFVAAVSLFLVRAAVAGPVIVVTDQTQEAIQAALDSLGGPGTVMIPPGRYQIDGTLLIRSDGVTLQGSGADQTVLFRLMDSTNTALVQSTGHAQVRITGIRFEGVSGESSDGQERGVLLQDAADFRVDNSFFTHTGFAGVRINGASSGVVDHCTFEDLFKPAVNDFGYGVVVYGINRLEMEPFGSARATFIEDSSFRLCRHAVASNQGARYVFRNNYVSQNVVAHAVDAHGLEGGGSLAGTEWIDAHDNLIEQPIYVGYAVRIRGGMGLVWNNSFVGYNQGIELTRLTPQPTGVIYVWGNSIDPATNPMLRAREDSTYSLSPPDDYVPYPYPHPLATAPP
jgi:hypothetical protein